MLKFKKISVLPHFVMIGSRTTGRLGLELKHVGEEGTLAARSRRQPDRRVLELSVPEETD
jgi:hypothetical protein